MLVDQEARIRATDPRLSCIVQAPAGSGKTEILTQRFLRLLSTVQAPEQIVALTFTRKAANEMRERVMHALLNATMLPTSPHQALTLRYAQEALAHDQLHQWQLLETPSRLRITTIDSLCQTLANAIPLQEKQTPYANITDTPFELYLTTARACFNHALNDEAYQKPLSILLEHLDNRVDRVLELFSEQLQSREQWLGRIYQAKSQNKRDFEQALSAIEQHEIARFKASIPTNCIEKLITLSRQLASVIDSQYEHVSLCHWRHLDELDRTLIHALSSLLLTTQLALRKGFDHHVGLKRDTCDTQTYQTIKTESKALLAELNDCTGFLEALLRVRTLPPPTYPSEQWTVLQALLQLLPLLAAHLQLTFNQTNTVDFTAIANQAQMALQAYDAPTDLALYLDHTIHHLLIDEFQDTSMQQFELLTQLVEGFEPHDHKTLFVVGDPMQSIYRFRGAEVGLFLHAERHGIGPVRLTSLQLRSNFRASETLVNWVNEQFKTIFPEQDDLESGAISYHHATAIHTTDPSDGVHAYQYVSRTEEAEAIVALVKQELSAHPSSNIALLVRTRKQLTTITQTLRAHHMPYQGIDIDWMSHLSHVRDVWSLTQALLMPANRLAWLSFLRSPWCGLSLDDLHLIANINRRRSIYHALAPQDSHQNLSHEGQQRVRYIYHVLHHALQHRHQQSLAQWIISTLEQLHLQVLLSDAEQDDLEQYWQLIDTYEQDGQLSDLKQFKTALDTLYSKRVTPSRLHIMTIHKAKGLEFECVILPCLNARAVSQDKPLLRWLTLPTSTSEPLVLVSPLKADSQDHCSLYDYLSKLNTEKEHYEQQRLLYVAVTRAKKRLYLLTHHHAASQTTFRGLLKQQTFIPIENTQINTSEDEQQSSYQMMLDYLPNEFYTTPPLHPTTSSSALTNLLSDDTSRITGVIAHELLQWICTHHPRTEHDVPWHMATYTLRQQGFNIAFIQQAEQRLKEYIVPLFHTPRGQWLIQAHEQEQNEYELLITHQQDMHTRIIDRFFYEQETPWIIDFKTGHHDTSTEEKHRAQVDAYAEHLHHRTLKSIRRGLYYLSTQHWVEW